MRLTTVWRAGALAVLAWVTGAGCDGKRLAVPAGGSTTDELKRLVAEGRTPRQVAEEFLRELSAGKVAADRLTPAFRSQVAPPKTDADRAAGYSEADLRAYLARFEKASYVIGEEQGIGPAIMIRGRADATDVRRQFSVRLIQVGDAGMVQADWLHLTERMGTSLKLPPDPDLAAAEDALRNFLDVLMGGDHRLAHALMTTELKKAISPLPPGGKPKDGRDYDPGFLTQATRAWIRDVVGYTFTKADLAPDKKAATVTVELEAGGQTTPATVRMVKDRATDWWLVLAFDK
jgi:hypothetical protein